MYIPGPTEGPAAPCTHIHVQANKFRSDERDGFHNRDDPVSSPTKAFINSHHGVPCKEVFQVG